MLTGRRQENSINTLLQSSHVMKWLLETGRFCDHESLSNAFIYAAKQGLLEAMQVIWYKADPPVEARTVINALVQAFDPYLNARDNQSISIDISLVQFLFGAVRDSGGNVNTFHVDEDETRNIISVILECILYRARRMNNLPGLMPIYCSVVSCPTRHQRQSANPFWWPSRKDHPVWSHV